MSYKLVPPGIRDSAIAEFTADFKALRGNQSSPRNIGRGAEYYILHVVFIPAARCRGQIDGI